MPRNLTPKQQREVEGFISALLGLAASADVEHKGPRILSINSENLEEVLDSLLEEGEITQAESVEDCKECSNSKCPNFTQLGRLKMSSEFLLKGWSNTEDFLSFMERFTPEISISEEIEVIGEAYVKISEKIREYTDNNITSLSLEEAQKNVQD